jgi:hypothetical protein
VSLRNIQRSQRARVSHQVLYLSGAPDCVESSLTVDTVAGTQAPEGVVQSVAVEDGDEKQWLVVGLRLAKMLEQLGPSVSARIVRADLVQGGVDHHLITS